MENLIVRCSSLANLMSNAIGKSPKGKYADALSSLNAKEIKYKETANKETKTAIKLYDDIQALKKTIRELKPFKDDILLSENTKTWVKEIAKQNFYQYRTEINSKYLDKGIMVEDESIELLNSVMFTDYKKNTERKDLTHPGGFIWLTGECDIFTGDMIRDIKSSWSLETFPAFAEDVEKSVTKSGYDWQMRGYMMLWNCESASVDFCLVDTPAELLSEFDNWNVHEVEHIAPEKRITSFLIERDLSIEADILERYDAANKYYKECLNELKSK